MCEFNAHGVGGRSTPGMQYYGAGGLENRPNGMAFYGSNGTIFADRIGYEIYPEGKFAEGPHALKRRHINVKRSTDRHAAHFIATIRDGAKLRWDSDKEDFMGTPDASRLLGRKARKPWDMISI